MKYLIFLFTFNTYANTDLAIKCCELAQASSESLHKAFKELNKDGRCEIYIKDNRCDEDAFLRSQMINSSKEKTKIKKFKIESH